MTRTEKVTTAPQIMIEEIVEDIHTKITTIPDRLLLVKNPGHLVILGAADKSILRIEIDIRHHVITIGPLPPAGDITMKMASKQRGMITVIIATLKKI